MKKIEILKQSLETTLTNKLTAVYIERAEELTIVVDSDNLIEVMGILQSNPEFAFTQCQDLCGVDYLTYHNDYVGLRFAVVYHLLSITKNWRARVKTFAKNNEFPIVKSVIDIWSSANWYEREAFDLFGIIFDGHPDLRRILTDYGFIGHPFRKDFPLSGYMEMRYDEEQKRVIYQPVTIEPREETPRIIREEHYGGRN